LSVLKHRRSTNVVAKSSIAAPEADAKVADRSGAVVSNAVALFSSPHQVTLGNPEGDVTLVEFFDYSCGFCKKALPDMLGLLKTDPKLKIVLKELPILGPGSADAARVAVAVRMQSPDGQKYLAFHQQLLSGAGRATRDKALAAAQDQGFDLARLDQDVSSEEVRATLNEDAKLAAALGVTGTPSYVIGDQVIVGAVGIAALKERIDAPVKVRDQLLRVPFVACCHEAWIGVDCRFQSVPDRRGIKLDVHEYIEPQAEASRPGKVGQFLS
jgi:protein-disulfide isomerase